LRFHTDTRSPKVAAIAADPAMTVLLYDPEAKVQIRARGIGRVETSGGLADAAWAQSTPFAKRCYLAENAPSADSDAAVSGLPEWVEGITPTEEQVAPGRENFAIVLVEVSSFDWLYLASTGHRRARFEFDGIQVSSTWLVP
jgi:pyridoxamine 5'-phosphate oxidase